MRSTSLHYFLLEEKGTKILQVLINVSFAVLLTSSLLHSASSNIPFSFASGISKQSVQTTDPKNPWGISLALFLQTEAKLLTSFSGCLQS